MTQGFFQNKLIIIMLVTETLFSLLVLAVLVVVIVRVIRMQAEGGRKDNKITKSQLIRWILVFIFCHICMYNIFWWERDEAIGIKIVLAIPALAYSLFYSFRSFRKPIEFYGVFYALRSLRFLLLFGSFQWVMVSQLVISALMLLPLLIAWKGWRSMKRMTPENSPPACDSKLDHR